jgi:hypothetical protein
MTLCFWLWRKPAYSLPAFRPPQYPIETKRPCRTQYIWQGPHSWLLGTRHFLMPYQAAIAAASNPIFSFPDPLNPPPPNFPASKPDRFTILCRFPFPFAWKQSHGDENLGGRSDQMLAGATEHVADRTGRQVRGGQAICLENRERRCQHDLQLSRQGDPMPRVQSSRVLGHNASEHGYQCLKRLAIPLHLRNMGCHSKALRSIHGNPGCHWNRFLSMHRNP